MIDNKLKKVNCKLNPNYAKVHVIVVEKFVDYIIQVFITNVHSEYRK